MSNGKIDASLFAKFNQISHKITFFVGENFKISRQLFHEYEYVYNL